MKWIKEHHMFIFFILVAIENMAANFAHPITPTLIQNLALPDYAFGLLYAGMAFTNFLFSPMWAKQVKRLGSRSVLGICCIGYGAGQMMFALMKTMETILCARLISGFFVGGIMVSFLTYIIQHADISIRGRYLALSATISTVCSAFGYLIGGFMGVVSIFATFTLQSMTLILCGVLFFLFLKEDKEEHMEAFRWKEANPFQAFMDARQFMNIAFFVLFFVAFITSTASTAYDQNFNYFIKDELQLNSSYNGILKAAVGFISLLANTTICMWIMKKTDVKKSVTVILGAAGAVLILMTMSNEMRTFFLINFLFFALNAIYIPLVQDLCAGASNAENGNMVMGFYNAMKSLGMISGALFSGFVYGFGSRLAFFYAGVFFFIAMVCMILYQSISKKA